MSMRMIILTILFFAVHIVFGKALRSIKQADEMNNEESIPENSATRHSEEKRSPYDIITNTS